MLPIKLKKPIAKAITLALILSLAAGNAKADLKTIRPIITRQESARIFQQRWKKYQALTERIIQKTQFHKNEIARLVKNDLNDTQRGYFTYLLSPEQKQKSRYLMIQWKFGFISMHELIERLELQTHQLYVFGWLYKTALPIEFTTKMKLILTQPTPRH